MSDSPTPPERPGDDAPDDTGPVNPPLAPLPRRRRRVVAFHWSRRLSAVLVAVVAAGLFSLVTVDLGRIFPWIRPLAEQQASKFLKRPMHIGRISALLTPGSFAIDDLRIEGLQPDAPPFFTAGRIYIHVPWWRLWSRRLDIEVDITDWRMTVESWEGGRHNLPNFKRESRSTGKSSFTTTVQFAYAKRGEFTYVDHATPWTTVARNLEFSLVRAHAIGKYVGLVSFHDGTTQIQQFLPMRTDMAARFELNGGKVRLNHIDLLTDGARSHVNGEVDFGNWPDQTYNVTSTVDFARMREIFFARERWRLGGEGKFVGVFRYPKDGQRVLSGSFTSAQATVNDLAFNDLHGALQWSREHFAVTHAEAKLLGGETRFEYALAPLGTRTGAMASFKANYSGVDVFDLDRLLDLRGLRLRGAASGTLSLEWPNGRFATGRRGEGHTVVAPPGNTILASSTLPDEPRAIVPEAQPFDGQPRGSTLTFGADLHYQFDPGGLVFDDSWAATPYTFIQFSGQAAAAGEARFPFHVTSHDWQESDRLLASIMTAVSGPTGAVEVGGRGTFDGEMTGRFSSPRITGRFEGESVRAWGVTWGRAVADLEIERGYVTLLDSRIGDRPEAFIVPVGRFALGFRNDGAAEIDASVAFRNWPVDDLKAAFQLTDWSMEGTVGQADLKLHGQYRDMYGGGSVRIVQGTAWGETFETATADVELEGTGMLLLPLVMAKSTGNIRGSARIGWDGTYEFNAEGVDVPVASLDAFRTPDLPITGQLSFTASGAGLFVSPSYEFDGTIVDVYIGDEGEGVGVVRGHLSVADNVITIDRLLATSGRLFARATGTIAIDDQWTSSLNLRFQETSVDPYLKFVLPGNVSPYTRIIASGSMAVHGPLADPMAVSATATIDEAAVTLYDYQFTNDGPLVATLEQGAFAIGNLKFTGPDTNLAVTGSASLRDRRLDFTASGGASLGILQFFYKGLTASGSASLNGRLSGSFDAPVISGRASITQGRLRPLDSPHSLEAIEGGIVFGAEGLEINGLRGRIGTGDVTFAGTIGLDGYVPDEFNLIAQGRSMRLRYPAGFSSTVDMDLFLNGPVAAPRLSGTVDVLRLSYIGLVEADASLLALSGGQATSVALPSPSSASGMPVTLDIQVTAPRMTLVDSRTAGMRVDGQADLQVRGTFDRPQILGAIEILGGEYIFNGNRYFVREGTINFADADRLEPVFDVSAETRPRVTGQTFVVNVRVTGTINSLNLTLTSDPWLPEADIVTLLFGGTPNYGAAEQRALVSSQELQQRMLQTAGAALLTSALTSRVGDVFEWTGAVDTVQITPVLANENAFQQLNPSARITLGKRISPRVFLTYSRTLNTAQEEIILLEYDQSDRVSWVLSRNEDRTYALDFRIRYVF